MRARVSSIVFVVALVLLIAPLAVRPSEEVFALGADPANTGVQPGPGPNPDDAVLERWRITDERLELDMSQWGMLDHSTGVAIQDSVAYFGAIDGSIRGVDVVTGEEIWRTGLSDAPFRGTPAVADGALYLQDGMQVLYAVDLADGSLKWRVDSDIGRFGNQPYFPSPVVADGIVYAGRWDGVLLAVDAEDGTELWRSQFSDAILAAPAVGDGVVLVTDRSGLIRGFDAAGGTVLWEDQADYELYAPFMIADGVAYLKHYYGVVALDPRTGTVAWYAQVEEADGGWYSAAAIDDGVLVMGSDQNLFAFAADGSGTMLWHQEFGGMYRLLASPVIADGIVYSICPGTGVCGYDLNTGELLWEVELETSTTTAPAVGDGFVVVGVGSHEIVALSNPSMEMAAATEEALSIEATATAEVFTAQTATAVAHATEQAIVDATSTALAEIRATEQAYEASWEAYFGAIGEAMAGSESLPPSMSIGDLDVEIDTDEETGATSVTAWYEVTISGGDVESSVAVMIAPSDDAAVNEMEIWRDSVVRSGWEVTDGPDLGDESGCATLIEDGSAIASCIYRDGDTLVAAGSEVPTESRDAALLNANDLLAVFAEAHESVGDPDA
ncbi:MAG: PQQ-binding-like beta-propeller repeat protein [Thermomicrobiales bacterium]|nr:PQQ-binding-like beta-propeller repeat protein [Thermomicrobiales bacterium]